MLWGWSDPVTSPALLLFFIIYPLLRVMESSFTNWHSIFGVLLVHVATFHSLSRIWNAPGWGPLRSVQVYTCTRLSPCCSLEDLGWYVGNFEGCNEVQRRAMPYLKWTALTREEGNYGRMREEQAARWIILFIMLKCFVSVLKRKIRTFV